MPGWYIHMDVARRATASLASNANAAPIFATGGPDAAALEKIAHDNPAYVALGAIGPDIFFLLPDFKPPVGNMLWKLAGTIKDLYTAWDDTFLGPYESAMGPIGNNLQDEINALTGGLKDVIDKIFSEAFKLLEDFVIKLILQQYDFFGLLSSGVPAGYDEQTFFWSDMLHYRETYHFGAQLWQRASAEPDPTWRERFQAFALGWMTHLATDVTGHAFVNEKAGGPYRLHWQRHHLVENHMDAAVYLHDNGARPIYQQISCGALHLWLAFNPDGSSRTDIYKPQPGPDYPDGDDSASITQRHAAWDVDSDIPDQLAGFIADTLKVVYTPALTAADTGMVACCPTIISTLDDRVPIATGGFATADDIVGAYWWLYKYVKWTTTDYYNIRRPDAPPVVVIPSFPSPPGSGDADPGPGASDDNGTWGDILDFLLALFAWVGWLAEVAVWPAAVIAGIIGGTVTYPLRMALYESLELPLYNAWLGIHTYLAMTGYVMPLAEEINPGLNTLGLSVNDNWAVTVAALNDPAGGLSAANLSPDPSGKGERTFPKDVLLDPPNAISQIFSEIFKAGAPAVNGELPSEFTRPWRWPDKDNQGDTVNTEWPLSVPGPYAAPANATVLFAGAPGSPTARAKFEASGSEAETNDLARSLLRLGQHLGDPQDYSAYVIASLTRKTVDPAKVANFNLDADRGYAYLCWDWVRDATRRAMPKQAFAGNPDPGNSNQPDDISQHVYPVPIAPGYGWNSDDQIMGPGVVPVTPFNPANPQASVRIRYIGREKKFI
jgi:hypothetical protein